MAKTISFKWDKDGREYTLAYTRDTAARIENAGFRASEIEDKMNVMLPLLWRGAFLANHGKTKEETIDEIFNSITDKEGLYKKLAEMYRETIETLFDEPEEGAKGNITWEASW